MWLREAEAEVQRQKREAPVLLTEQEARTELLRKKARLSAPGGDKSGSDLISLDSEKPSGHLNLFQGLQEVSNKEYQEEKKQEKERKEKALGILTYLGQSAAESQTSAPWYQELPDRSKAIAKDEKLKGRLDPLAEMGKYLYKKCSHKKEEKKEKGKSKHKESKGNLALRPPSSSTSCCLEQLRQERLQHEQAERARTESLLAQRSGMGPFREEEEEMDERKRGYNSQFNPQLARKSVVRDSRIEWAEESKEKAEEKPATAPPPPSCGHF
ncbi:leukocyte receptor cluster member 1 [Crotalus adamanteus]|uniref:Leukocyte receptor cluster member 1 n=1 Tax=Crotalus adamanteus TaxID=8729 RepID=A0AAW1B128_CROAD